ncbi:DNA repair protein rad5 [Seiridium cupressi]
MEFLASRDLATSETGVPPGVLSLKRSYPFGPDEYSYTRTRTSSIPLDDQLASLESNKNVSFGSIIDVKVQPHNTDRFEQFTAWSWSAVQSFAVVQEGDFLTLEFGGTKFGRLNKGLCRHLHDLVANGQIRVEAFIFSKDLTIAMKSRNGPAPRLPAELNIYGLKENAQKVGGVLSNSGIFLQMPQYGLENVKYSNPHILIMEGYPELLALDPSHNPTNDTRETPDSRLEAGGRGDDTTMFDSILDSLSHHSVLQEISIVPDIKTTLLIHQKEAVDFVRCRETAQMNSDLSLWKYNDVDADEPFYQHVLSGAKQPERAEARGGIIADEMGLGKSLVIISTIAGSLDRAEAFVTTESQLFYQPQGKATSRATLIIAPSSPLSSLSNRHTYPGALLFHKHIGTARHKETNLLFERPIVFTTYATVAAESRRGDSSLAKINWFRIVLDEAHDIRNRSTKQFQAVSSISALHRWCLTGTPIQNSLEDIGTLVSFLRVPILEKAPIFRKLIINPINSASRSRFQNLQALLRTVCLRRTRQLLDLPEPISQLRRLPLTPSEQSDYQDLLAQGRTEIDMAVSRRGKSNINSSFLESLLKLRLFCNNGRKNAVMQSGPTGLPVDPDEALIYLQQHEQDVCAYCSGTIYFINEKAATDGGMFMSSCSHLVCHNCVSYHRAEKQRCPICAAKHGSISQTTLPSRSMDIETLRIGENHEKRSYPSKLLALLSDVRRNPTHKSIIFSSWKKTLGLVSELLANHGIRHNTIDGSLPLAERIKVLSDFRSFNGANILLMTLGTGAVKSGDCITSLSLRTAVKPIHRVAQTTDILQNNVLFRQKRKLELAGGGFNKGKDMQPDRLEALLDVFGVDKNLVQ